MAYTMKTGQGNTSLNADIIDTETKIELLPVNDLEPNLIKDDEIEETSEFRIQVSSAINCHVHTNG